jgi:branched-chain amino acid transport system permease protein
MPTSAVFVNAVLSGAAIVLMASGLVLVFSVMGIVNWAHGQLYMLGAFGVYALVSHAGLHYVPALLLAALLVALVGVAIELLLLRPLGSKGLLQPTACALGLVFVFEGLAMLLFGKDQKAINSGIGGNVSVVGLDVSKERLALVIVAFAVMGLLGLLINRTRLGLAIRASAESRTVAEMYGARSGRLFSLVMGVGCGLAGLAGGLIAPVYMVNPWIGSQPMTLALATIVIGGLGSLKGAVVGGMALGFTNSLVGFYVGPWSDMVAFGLIIAFILFRPQGLFGHQEGRV